MNQKGIRKYFYFFCSIFFLVTSCATTDSNFKSVQRSLASLEGFKEIDAITGEKYILIHRSTIYTFLKGEAEKDVKERAEAACKKLGPRGKLVDIPAIISHDGQSDLVQMCRF